jgi:hypothetical protein
MMKIFYSPNNISNDSNFTRTKEVLNLFLTEKLQLDGILMVKPLEALES